MRRAFSTAATVLAALLLLNAGLCGDDSSPTNPDDGGGGGGGGGAIAYTIPPFDVVRHGANLNGVWMDDRAVITAGDSGAVFVETAEGRFMLPTGSYADATDAWMSESGVIFVTQEESGYNSPGMVKRYVHGLRYIRGVGSQAQPASFTSVHGTGEKAYAGSSFGDVDYFDGSKWDRRTPAGTAIQAVWTEPDGMTYAAAMDGVYRGYAMEWERAYTTLGSFRGIGGVSRDDVMTVIAYDVIVYDGQEWKSVQTSDVQLWDVDYMAPGFAVAVGNDGVTWVLEGSTWQRKTVTPERTLKAVSGYAAAGINTAVAVGDSAAQYTYLNGVWSGGYSRGWPWRDVMGASVSVAYGIYGDLLMRWENATKTWEHFLAPPTLDFTHLWCGGENDIWAVGRSDIDYFAAHYDGNTWTTRWITSMNTPSDICAVDASNVYIACNYGTVYAGAGSFIPHSVIQPPQHLRGVWGVAADHVWVVGENGTIVFWNGTTWTPMASGTTEHLNAIDGSNSTNILAVGDNGTMLRFDGNAWTPVDTGIDEDITMVSVRYSVNMWAATATGTVLHNDGQQWTTLETGLKHIRHNAISAAAGSGVWIVCDRDYVLKYALPPAL